MNQEEIKERQQEATNRFRNIKILATISYFFIHGTRLIAEHYDRKSISC